MNPVDAANKQLEEQGAVQDKVIDSRDPVVLYKARIQAISNIKGLANIRQRRQMKIAAIQELQRDILNTSVLFGRLQTSSIDKNSYPNYESQVEACYKMYNGQTSYGGELFGSVADMRVAFIGGEGVSFTCKNQKKTDFISAFLAYNKLRGSKLLEAVLMGEIEGKVLFTLASASVKKDDPLLVNGNVKARLFSWYLNRYLVERDTADHEEIKSITYKKNEQDATPANIDLSKSVYIKLGGPDYKQFDKTTTKLGKILTQCENASRATYDLRKNTHFFGKIMPYWKTENAAEARVINEAVSAKSFEIGDGYAGPADMRLLEPSGSAAKVILDDALASLRYICSMTGVPIHWMAWPELMSNRATAENLMEVVYASTKKERLIWEEGLLNLFNKAVLIAADTGWGNEILDGDIEVKLPLISLAALKQMVDVWLPIYQEHLVSKFTMMNMLPGIDPDQEQDLIDDEKKTAAKNSPLANMTIPPVVPVNLNNPPQIDPSTGKPFPGNQPTVYKPSINSPKQGAQNG